MIYAYGFCVSFGTGYAVTVIGNRYSILCDVVPTCIGYLQLDTVRCSHESENDSEANRQ